MSNQKSADAATARPHVFTALGLTVVLNLLFRPWVGAPPYDAELFWAAASGTAVGFVLQAMLVGGAVWTAIWFIFLRRLKYPPGPATGFAVMAAAWATSMAGWAVGAALA